MSRHDAAPAAPLTLMDLLNSRENRVNHQRKLLEQYTFCQVSAAHFTPGLVEKRRNVALVSMTLNIPGPVKDCPEYRKALETGLHRLKAMLDSEPILHEEFRPLITGPEGYLILGSGSTKQTVEEFALEIKKAAVAAEEADALGRLFDMDVLIIDDAAKADEDGHFNLTDIRSISRSQLGAGPRKCLLCGENAKACARSRAHSMDSLLHKINEILSDAGL